MPHVACHFPVHCADLLLYCGGRTLFTALPPSWSGICTIEGLLLQLILLSQKGGACAPAQEGRSTWPSDLTQGSPPYVDVFGVPDERKLAEQLAATSSMAVQKRMPIDVLLAGKGVCPMFSDQSCTYISNNTDLITLSKELKENLGIDNPLGK